MRVFVICAALLVAAPVLGGCSADANRFGGGGEFAAAAPPPSLTAAVAVAAPTVDYGSVVSCMDTTKTPAREYSLAWKKGGSGVCHITVDMSSLAEAVTSGQPAGFVTGTITGRSPVGPVGSRVKVPYKIEGMTLWLFPWDKSLLDS